MERGDQGKTDIKPDEVNLHHNSSDQITKSEPKDSNEKRLPPPGFPIQDSTNQSIDLKKVTEKNTKRWQWKTK